MNLPIPSGFGVRCLARTPARVNGALTAFRYPMEPGSASAPATSPDALDALESQVLALLRGEPDGLELSTLRARIQGAEGDKLYHEAPPIDPSEGRHSTAELHRLLDMLAGATPEPPLTRTRAGYTLCRKGFRKNEPGVCPALIAALGSQNLRALFSDLWAVDALVWDKLEKASREELARLWLESPGRRLVQDLSVLDAMPHGARLGATDFSPARINAAVGLERLVTHDEIPNALRAHHELYLAVAGQEYLSIWEPKPDPTQRTQQIVRALELLEAGSPLGLRGAALRWLLDEAVDKPFYEVDGVRRDVREDLTMRLGTALRSWLAAPNENVSGRLETLALHHAARFVEGDTSEHATKRAWAIARWLQGCLRRSPFYGGDEEVLAAHLEARLSEAPTVTEGMDVLHPARFTLDDEGLSVAEISFVAAVILHYEQPRERQLLPTPMPIVHALRKLANRAATTAEKEADKARLAGHNALEWPKEDPIIVPLAARRLMTELRIGWLGHVGEEAQIDTLERFRKDPDEFGWVAFLMHREGKRLTAGARATAVTVFRDLAAANRVKPHLVGTFASGILVELSNDEVMFVLDIAAQSRPPWGPFVVDAVLGAMSTVQTNSLWSPAIERLVLWMEDTTADSKIRQNAALFAMRHLSAATKAPDRMKWLTRVADAAREQPFLTHTGLQGELRRLGLTKPNLPRTKP